MTLDDLIAIAEQATPGEWAIDITGPHSMVPIRGIQGFANFAHIAAFSPATVLPLLKELSALREEIGCIKRELAAADPILARLTPDLKTQVEAQARADSAEAENAALRDRLSALATADAPSAGPTAKDAHVTTNRSQATTGPNILTVGDREDR